MSDLYRMFYLNCNNDVPRNTNSSFVKYTQCLFIVPSYIYLQIQEISSITISI